MRGAHGPDTEAEAEHMSSTVDQIDRLASELRGRVRGGIEEARRRGVSVAYIADRAGVDPANLYAWVAGRADGLSVRSLDRIESTLVDEKIL